MKNLLLTLVAFSVLLLIGCQENSITDPTQDIELQKDDGPNVNRGTIILEDVLNNPYPVMNSFYKITGEVQYLETLQLFDPIPPIPQYMAFLQISISADLIELCTTCSPPVTDPIAGYIVSEFSDEILINSDDAYLLQKSFAIEGREDGMVLRADFSVTTNGVELNDMWLELSNDDNGLNKNIGPKPVSVPPVVKHIN